MLVLAIALTAAEGLGKPPVPTVLDLFTEEAEEWVLHGKPLPPDYRVRLMEMTPADRLQAIIFLRRAGLLTGSVWTINDLLRPQGSIRKDKK